MSKRDFVGPGLPARLSVNPTEPHYDPRANGLSDLIDVLVDGVLLEEVSSWDVAAGWVKRRKRAADGNLVIENRVPAHETLHGRVEVRWADRATPDARQRALRS